LIKKVVENGKLIFPRKFAKRFDVNRKNWIAVNDATCMDYVEHLKKKMPLDEFSAQYLNEPFSSENQLFKPEFFKYWNRRPDELFVGMFIDLAISERVQADETAIVILGMDRDWRIYVLDYLKGRWKPTDIVGNIFDMHAKWKPHCTGMETNGFQRTLKLACEDEMRKRKQYFPIDEIKTGPESTKESRIKSLEPFYRKGDVFHSLWMKGKDLENQLQAFPKGRHDDLIDAMAMGLPLMNPGVMGRSEPLKEWTWDWCVEQAFRNNRPYQGFFDYGR